MFSLPLGLKVPLSEADPVCSALLQLESALVCWGLFLPQHSPASQILQKYENPSTTLPPATTEQVSAAPPGEQLLGSLGWTGSVVLFVQLQFRSKTSDAFENACLLTKPVPQATCLHLLPSHAVHFLTTCSAQLLRYLRG